jgi:outer membrane biosynthesis protein TonB
MAAKKKTKKKQTKKSQTKKSQTKKNQTRSKPAPRKAKAANRSAPSAKKVKSTKRQPIPSKRAVKKRAVQSRELKSKTIAKRPVTKKATAAKKRSRGSSPTMNVVESPLNSSRARAGGQSGDLQGLSNLEGAASESVDELLEEGNSFEAGVVAGVERAGNADEEEVRTHEVPEDDVPGEYLDRDR